MTGEVYDDGCGEFISVIVRIIVRIVVASGAIPEVSESQNDLLCCMLLTG